MAAIFPPIRLHTLPLQMKAHTFTHALLNLWDYYIGSQARKCIIMDLRISHLHRLEVTCDDGRASSGLRLLETPQFTSVHVIARIWQRLRSPEYGLSETLITAIQQVSCNKREPDTHEEERHARDVDDFVTSFRELDAIFMGGEHAVQDAEDECVALMKEDIAQNPGRTLYSLAQVNSRPDATSAAAALEGHLKACPGDVARLCAERSYTRGWNARQLEQRRDWPTDDDALNVFLNRRPTKQRATATVDDVASSTKPPKAKRRKQIMTAQNHCSPASPSSPRNDVLAPDTHQ